MYWRILQERLIQKSENLLDFPEFWNLIDKNKRGIYTYFEEGRRGEQGIF